MGGQESMNVPIWNGKGFRQQDRQKSQNLNNDTFYRLPATSAQGVIGTGKAPKSALLIKYDDDDYFQGYGQIKEPFRALT